MGGVFVNYRTKDGEWPARMIANELAARFGAHQVFYASTSIRPGDDFAREIRRRLAGSDILLAVVGESWLADASGRRRIDDPDDWVRYEIRAAFEHGVRVIPVLIDDVPRLSEDDLPADIGALARCQYLRLRHRDRANGDVVALVDELTALLPARGAEPWRARVRDVRGAVRGAGVLLGGEYVLTCAHVVRAADGDIAGEVFVELVGLDGTPRHVARVVPEWCVWPGADQRGDVALLRLDRPLRDRVGAMLRNAALSWDRPVRVCGFPRGLEDGVYTRATLTGFGGPGAEWLQMNARHPGEQRIRAGFSGAGVVDDRTGDVLGIVVGEYTDEAANLSWMIPVETILGHLPKVADWEIGRGVAEEFPAPPDAAATGHDELARGIAAWLARRDTGDCLMILTGPATAALYRAVSLASRWQPKTLGRPHERNAPSAGSIDLAVDGAGKTADDVSRRILDRAGMPVNDTGMPANDTVSPSERLRAGMPAMTIVVAGVDAAKDPDALVNDVVKPLVDGGSRLLLGFRNESAPSLAAVRSWDAGTVGSRLDRLAGQIQALEEAEQRVMSLRRHVRDTLPVDYHGVRLGVALDEIRKLAADDHASVERLLARCERKTARTLRGTARIQAYLEEGLAERDALRGGLGAYQAKANVEGLVEDLAVATAYRRAHDLLWRSPTDLPSARAAFRDYREVIRRAADAAREPGEDTP